MDRVEFSFKVGDIPRKVLESPFPSKSVDEVSASLVSLGVFKSRKD